MTLYETLKNIFTTSGPQYPDVALALSCLDALSKPGMLPENPPDDYRVAVAALLMVIMTRFEAVLKCMATTSTDFDVFAECIGAPLGADGERANILCRLLQQTAEEARGKLSSV